MMLHLKNSFFKHFLKDCIGVLLFVSCDKLFQILGALNENALPANEFGGMSVFKEMLVDDRRVIISISTRRTYTYARAHESA